MKRLIKSSVEAVKYPNGEVVRIDSPDMDRYLSYYFGTDRDLDNSNYSVEEMQRAVDYWFKKHEASPY